MEKETHKGVNLWNEKNEQPKLYPPWVRILFWSVLGLVVLAYFVSSFFPEEIWSFCQSVANIFWENVPK